MPLVHTAVHRLFSISSWNSVLFQKHPQFDDFVRQHGIMGLVYFIVKQPPLQMKIYKAEMFTDKVMY